MRRRVTLKSADFRIYPEKPRLRQRAMTAGSSSAVYATKISSGLRLRMRRKSLSRSKRGMCMSMSTRSGSLFSIIAETCLKSGHSMSSAKLSRSSRALRPMMIAGWSSTATMRNAIGKNSEAIVSAKFYFDRHWTMVFHSCGFFSTCPCVILLSRSDRT